MIDVIEQTVLVAVASFQIVSVLRSTQRRHWHRTEWVIAIMQLWVAFVLLRLAIMITV